MTGTGFQVVATSASFPMEFFLLMGQNYVGDEALGKRCHQQRMQFEKNLSATPAGTEFLKRFYEFLAGQGVGRTLIMLGQK
jgi:hypothetical protein